MSSDPHDRHLLDVAHLGKSFRGLRALDDVNLYVDAGETLGVIGPNGAGKTTLFNCLTGYLPPTNGAITFQGQNITGKHMPAVTRFGIARTFQNIRLFGALSALDNVRAAQQLHTRFNIIEFVAGLPSFARKERELTEKAMAHLALFGLADHADRQASSLAYGMQRRLEIARALATGPRLLLLDEPAAGMNHSETDTLHDMIQQVKQQYGVSIILVEHDMRLVMNICDRITVLNYGRVLATGTPDAIRHNPEVIQSYLGKSKTQRATAS
jgi:branched-chain amino acid transport system ATP-binding protein